jgi:hypothetical protein
MKNTIALLILFFIVPKIYSLENGISSGIFGAGVSIEEGFADWFLFGHIVNFTSEFDSGLGISLSPLNFSVGIKDFRLISLTFLNMSVFYDFLKNENILFGPFTSLNTLTYNRLDYFEVKTGLTFSLKDFRDGLFCFNYLYSELGYKYNNNSNKHSLYIQLGVDLLWPILLTGVALGNSDTKTIQNIQNIRPID